jgi:two-component system, NtrC family, sensor kinase
MSILIADDDLSSRKLLQKMLEKLGYSTIIAEDGEKAWEVYQEKMPRIIISDWVMPNMDGLDLCRKIRSAPAESYTYIIIITSKTKTVDLIEAFNAGADDYISKPFDPEELKVRIKNSERILDLENRHKDFQKILERSRNKLQVVLDGLYEEIAAVNRSNLFVSLNKAAMNAFGGKYNDLIGKDCFKINQTLSEPIWGSTIETLSQKVFESGSPEFTLDKLKDQKGNFKYKQQSILPIKVEDGQVEQVILVSRDVTQEHIKTNEIKDLNERLKKTTVEVHAKNIKLETALKQIEETQAQILQSEKMASIGQLAAGVAHEINNPVGFVNSNLKTLGDYHQDLKKLIDLYRNLVKEIKSSDETVKLPSQLMTQLEEVETIEDDVDIEYIQEDIGELIDDCLEGTERIRKIVLDLKDFAHPGEDKLKDTDINNGLESTLNVVHNELKYKAKIIKQFNELPIVQCYPQQINQVFMNILVNAAQAIEKSGEITIETESKNGAVEVRISDTGSGIPKENLTRIFDPFFTTKEVGKGTGLGMNIAYNIIKKHNGTITVDSKVGEGTTFTIRLPIAADSSEEDKPDQPHEN